MMKKLPVGIESFEEFSKEDFYYVDKTKFIADLLQNRGKVNLFTRPRRFGKTLALDTLKSFFEFDCNKELFNDLKISQEKELCEQYMGQFPVIFITLKGATGLNYRQAENAMRYIIGSEAMRFQFLLRSDRLTVADKQAYQELINISSATGFSMSDTTLHTSLKTLSQLLAKHYEKKVILLIDEYDVPLDKAFQNGYYEEMVSLIRNLFGNVLKTNPDLYFAVITGCLRISKESIFTGLNNLKVNTISDPRFDDAFGFTDEEVDELLSFYKLEACKEEIKDWYDGYQFGKKQIYCPWDVISYCDDLLADSTMPPKNYWANTSGNDMVRRFIDKADQTTRNEIEQLIAGESIQKEIRPELTYRELDASIDNLWSVLLTTGYLTAIERVSAKEYRLAIPNAEIRDLFITQIKDWFKDITRADLERRRMKKVLKYGMAFCEKECMVTLAE